MKSLRSVKALHAAAWEATCDAIEDRVRSEVIRASRRHPGVEVIFHNGVGWGWAGKIGDRNWFPRVGRTIDVLCEELGQKISFPANFSFKALDGKIVGHRSHKD